MKFFEEFQKLFEETIQLFFIDLVKATKFWKAKKTSLINNMIMRKIQKNFTLKIQNKK
jgi:hypothetical protein